MAEEQEFDSKRACTAASKSASEKLLRQTLHLRFNQTRGSARQLLKSATDPMPRAADGNFDLLSKRLARRAMPEEARPRSHPTTPLSGIPPPTGQPQQSSGTSNQNLRPSKNDLRDSWQLDVTLLDPSGRPISVVPTGYAFSYDDYSIGFPFEASPGRLRVLVPQQPNTVYRIQLFDMPGYTPLILLRVGAIAGNTSVSFTLKPAAQAKVRLNVEGGSALPDGARFVQCDSTETIRSSDIPLPGCRCQHRCNAALT